MGAGLAEHEPPSTLPQSFKRTPRALRVRGQRAAPGAQGGAGRGGAGLGGAGRGGLGLGAGRHLLRDPRAEKAERGGGGRGYGAQGRGGSALGSPGQRRPVSAREGAGRRGRGAGRSGRGSRRSDAGRTGEDAHGALRAVPRRDPRLGLLAVLSAVSRADLSGSRALTPS